METKRILVTGTLPMLRKVANALKTSIVKLEHRGISALPTVALQVPSTTVLDGSLATIPLVGDIGRDGILRYYLDGAPAQLPIENLIAMAQFASQKAPHNTKT